MQFNARYWELFNLLMIRMFQFARVWEDMSRSFVMGRQDVLAVEINTPDINRILRLFSLTVRWYIPSLAAFVCLGSTSVYSIAYLWWSRYKRRYRFPTTSNSGTRHCGTSTCQMAQTLSECFTRATDTARPGLGTRKARFECTFVSDYHPITEFLCLLVGAICPEYIRHTIWVRDRFCSCFYLGTHFGLDLRRVCTLCDAASWQLQTNKFFIRIVQAQALGELIAHSRDKPMFSRPDRTGWIRWVSARRRKRKRKTSELAEQ